MLTSFKVLVAAGLAAAGMTVGPAQPATSVSAAPSIAIGFDDPYPLSVPRWLRNSSSFDRGVLGEVVVTGGSVTNLRIELLNSDGLTFNQNPLVDTAGPTTNSRFGFSVASTTGGFHQVTIKITSDQTGTTTAPGPLFYVAGGDPIPATGDLTGLAYGWTDKYEYDRGEAEGSEDYLLTFVDHDTAFFGAPKRGLPECRRFKPDARYVGCVPYRYDAATGNVELGGGRIAQVVGNRLWVSGLGRPYDEGTYVNERFLTDHVAYPKAGKRFNGRWTGGETNDAHRRYSLTLTRSGEFVLRASRYSTGGRVSITQRGSYRLTGAGKLVLRSRSGHRTVHTFAVSATPDGKLMPQKAVWMVFRNRGSDGTVYYDEIKLRRL